MITTFKYRVPVKCFPRNFILYCFLLFTAHSFSQSAYIKSSLTDVEISSDSLNSIINIKLICSEYKENLLLFITDEAGTMIFLESRHRFKGEYSKKLDLSKQPKGDFLVNIISDDDKINKKISLK